MKLAALFKNDSHGGLSAQLEELLTKNLDTANDLLQDTKRPTAIIVLDSGLLTMPRNELVHHLAPYGIKSTGEYEGVLRPSEEGFARMVYKTALGNGFCDVLVEEA
jgi:hypothetical protein